MSLGGVVFDLDDTLTDHRDLELEVFDQVLRIIADRLPHVDTAAFTERHALGLEPLYEALLAGEVAEEDFQRIRLTHALEPWDVVPDETLVADYSRLKQRLYDEVRRAPGALEAVQAVRAAGLRVGVLTNGLAELQTVKLARIGLTDAIDVFVPTGDLGVHKPDPEAFTATARRMGLPVERLAMVGDNLRNDVHGALGAGFAAAVLVRAWRDPGPLPPGGHVAEDAHAAVRLLGI